MASAEWYGKEYRELGSRTARSLAREFGGSHGDEQADRGDNARKGAVRKPTQLKTKVKGEDRWTKRDKGSTKRDKGSGALMAQKKRKKKFKGGRREK